MGVKRGDGRAPGGIDDRQQFTVTGYVKPEKASIIVNLPEEDKPAVSEPIGEPDMSKVDSGDNVQEFNIADIQAEANRQERLKQAGEELRARAAAREQAAREQAERVARAQEAEIKDKKAATSFLDKIKDWGRKK